MQYQHTKRELEMAELIEGSERDRRRLAELLDGIRVGPGVDAMADGMREAVWADVRSRIRPPGESGCRIVRYAAAAAVMAGVVCGSWFMGGRRTESRLVAAAQPGERLDASGREVRRGAARRFAGAAQRRHAHRLSRAVRRRTPRGGRRRGLFRGRARRPQALRRRHGTGRLDGARNDFQCARLFRGRELPDHAGDGQLAGGRRSRVAERAAASRRAGILREDLRAAVAAQGGTSSRCSRGRRTGSTSGPNPWRRSPGASKGSSTSTSRSPTNGCAGSVSRVSSSTARTSTKSCGSSRPTAASSAAAARTISSFTETDRDSRFFSLQPKFQSL